MNESKKKKLMEAEVNIKTMYRPFKRCFKHPANTVTKWLWNFIHRAEYTKKPVFVHSDSKPCRGRRNLRYASIKGCCGLKGNEFLR